MYSYLIIAISRIYTVDDLTRDATDFQQIVLGHISAGGFTFSDVQKKEEEEGFHFHMDCQNRKWSSK